MDSIYDNERNEQLVRIADALERIAAILAVQTRAQLSQSQGPAAASFGAAADIHAEIAEALSPRTRRAQGGG